MNLLRFNILLADKYNYLVGSNITNFFALGEFLKKDDFCLIGYHKPSGKIAVSGNIFSSNGNQLCTIDDNFELTSLNPENLLVWKTLANDEIELIDNAGMRVLYAKTKYIPRVQTVRGVIATNVTELIGEFYNKKGKIVAKGTQDRLELFLTKGVFGISMSGSLGLVMNCNRDETTFLRQFAKEHLR